jgi:endonuclease YncB( thermonuclease family)
MKRMQFYLQENIWKALHVRSRQQGLSISELVRQAVIEKYGNLPASRKEAMRALVGIWKDRRDVPDSTTYVRRLRGRKRLRRISSCCPS